MILSEGLQDYIIDCRIRNYSEETLKVVKGNVEKLIRFVGDKDLKVVTQRYIKAYILSCKDTSKASTINTQIRNIKGMFKYFVQEGEITKNPFEDIQLLKEEKKVMRTYSTDLVKTIFEALDKHDFISIRNKTILTLLVETGIRCSELINIKMEDIKDNAIEIHGKGNKIRYVPLTDALGLQLTKFKKERDKYLDREADTLFVSQLKKPLTRTGLYQLINNEVFKGIEDTDGVPITVHNFRRFFAQQMLDNVDLYTVSRLLGHSNITTTERYVRGTEDKKILERGMNSPLSTLYK